MEIDSYSYMVILFYNFNTYFKKDNLLKFIILVKDKNHKII